MWVKSTNNAMNIAYLEIFFDNFSNFTCKNVFYSSKEITSFFLFLLKNVFSPTAQTKAFPCPVITLELVYKKQSGLAS